MKFSRMTLMVAVIACTWAGGLIVGERLSAQVQTGTPTGPRVAQPSFGAGISTKTPAGEYFKNVTTSTLKTLPVDDFVESMGVIAAAMGYDCSDCHPGAGTDKVDWVIDPPIKRTTRRMVEMVATINQTNFGGAQRVTCWTCHHGKNIPATSIALEKWYEAPNSEVDDVVTPEADQPGRPQTVPEQVLDKYIAAVGGAQRWMGINSWVATGRNTTYAVAGAQAAFNIYAKAPNQRTTMYSFPNSPERGSSVWAFSGTQGWMKQPRSLLGQWEQVGGDLDGARLEAQLSFPPAIKTALTNWRAGGRRQIGDKDYIVIQGTGPRGLLGTFYFDQDTGLLARMIKLTPSPIGRIQIQIDYGDYRDIGNGLKMPFDYKFLWLDGRFDAKIDNYKTNVPIDAKLFAEPPANQ